MRLTQPCFIILVITGLLPKYRLLENQFELRYQSAPAEWFFKL
jgi:hypothetical protein